MYLSPTAELATRALLTPDPAMAMALATELLTAPLMSNHSYGLWGYSGVNEGGLELTVQSTGIGAQSAAVVLDELADLGVGEAVALGVGEPLGGGTATSSVIVVDEAIPADGASRDLYDGPLSADLELSSRLLAALDPIGAISGAALGGWERGRPVPAANRAVVRSLEVAALLAVARLRSLALACVLIAQPGADEADVAESPLLTVGRAAAEALGSGS